MSHFLRFSSCTLAQGLWQRAQFARMTRKKSASVTRDR